MKTLLNAQHLAIQRIDILVVAHLIAPVGRLAVLVLIARDGSDRCREKHLYPVFPAKVEDSLRLQGK